MGNCCGSPPPLPSDDSPEHLRMKRQIVTKTDAGNELWRELHLEQELLVKNIHPHVLKKTIINAANARTPKSLDDKPDQDNNSEDEEDEDKWLCEGTVKFKTGCKSGQKPDAFDYYADTERWSCPDSKCDFDLCEMCTRWCIHCERTGTDIGWAVEKAAEDPSD